MSSQIAIGILIAGGCLMGLRHDRWIFEHSGYGRWLTWLFGPERGLWALRGLMVLFALFGLLLAMNFIRPLHW